MSVGWNLSLSYLPANDPESLSALNYLAHRCWTPSCCYRLPSQHSKCPLGNRANPNHSRIKASGLMAEMPFNPSNLKLKCKLEAPLLRTSSDRSSHIAFSKKQRSFPKRLVLTVHKRCLPSTSNQVAHRLKAKLHPPMANYADFPPLLTGLLVIATCRG
ncbi:hypothetical protein ECG_05034 [Echinococcus granulosus]|nr:hypothetical protein ECG_05034 [Echinococcus granulosus]